MPPVGRPPSAKMLLIIQSGVDLIADHRPVYRGASGEPDLVCHQLKEIGSCRIEGAPFSARQ
jgi:hypothetical protein